MASIGDLTVGDLRITVTEPAGSVRLDWLGKSNSREPAKVLAPFFGDVALRAAELKAPVEMHFEALAHFNSSTITALIRFIQATRSKGVALVLVYDNAQKWQRLSFDALRIFEKSDGLLTLRSAT